MNCPHCQKELPANYGALWCPFCGRDLFPEQTSPVEPAQLNRLAFFAVLLAPAVLSFVGIALNIGVLVVIATFGGSLVAGGVCSAMLDEQRGYSTIVRWMVAAVLAVLSFILCFGGCMAGAGIIHH